MSQRTVLKDETAQEEFLENIELNMAFMEEFVVELPDEDIAFARSLIDYYKKFEMLTPKQVPHATKFWQELNSKGLK